MDIFEKVGKKFGLIKDEEKSKTEQMQEKRNSLIEKAKEHDIREKDIKTSLYYFNINL